MFKFIKNKIQEMKLKSEEKERARQEQMKKEANIQILREEMIQLTSDGKLTEGEIKSIEDRKQELGLTDDDIKLAKVTAYATAFNKAVEDSALTEEEENELNNIQEVLQLSDDVIDMNKKILARYRLVREIQNGNMPSLQISNIVLKKGEQVYWSETSSLLEEKVISRYYEGGSSGFSFRVMKGVSYRVGGFRGHPVVETGTVSASDGELILTSKRIIFRGDRKSFATNLDKILDIEFYSNGIRFSENNRSKPRLIQFDDRNNTDIIGSVISYAINHYSSK